MRVSEVVRRLREGVAAAGRYSNPAQESVELHQHVAELIDDLEREVDFDTQLDRDDVDGFLEKLNRYGLGWADSPSVMTPWREIRLDRRGDYVLLAEVAHFLRNPDDPPVHVPTDGLE